MTRKEYLLGLAAEEALEVAHRVHKALRFGLKEIQPGQSKNNADRVMEEYADLICVMTKLQEESILPTEEVLNWFPEHLEKKEAKIEKYMEYSTKQGIING